MERGGGRGLGAQDVLLLGAVVALPWWAGGVALGAWRTAAAVVAMAAGWALTRDGATGLGLARGARWLLPAFLLGAWALAQAVPLPRAWVGRLSPKAASLQQAAFGPAGQGAASWLREIESDARARVPEAAAAVVDPAAALELPATAPTPPRWFTLSLAPAATVERALWYVSLLAAFLLVLRRTADPRRAAAYRTALLVFFGVLATVALLNRVSAPDRLLWVRAIPPETQPFGPYVNPSHFAGAMELGVPWMLGCGLWSLSRRPQSERRLVVGWLAVLGAGLGAVAALLAASKLGAVTIGATSLILIVIAIRRAPERRALLAVAAATALLLGGIAVYGPLQRRMTEFIVVHAGDSATNVRGLAWGAGLRMARDFPLTGSGFGAFPEVFPAYLPGGESEVWFQLHNDYLEIAIAGGVVALALVVWLGAGFATRVARALRAESESGRLLPALGLVFGLSALAVHEAVDFNLQIPANALLFVVMAAMAVSPSARAEP